MGINYERAKMILGSNKKNAFNEIISLGHQKVNITFSELKSLNNEFNLDIDLKKIKKIKFREYATDFFSIFLNSRKYDIIDYSDYEGANIIQDLNFPISKDMYEKYDAVIDGGTLEHIFNFPVAIDNCMKLVKKGGSIFIFSMANNHCGHGFYQFSPELFFRIFDTCNGFEIQKVILTEQKYPGAELSPKRTCYEVIDPKEFSKRINIVNSKPLGIMVHAVKVETISIFTHIPQQSDYTKAWKKTKAELPIDGKYNLKSFLIKIINLLPFKIRNSVYGFHELRNSRLRNKKPFKKWN
tara:strand:+ start:1813 stop:2703 length:891 start_codon:yes stop_codon:yes gene_type:complete